MILHAVIESNGDGSYSLRVYKELDMAMLHTNHIKDTEYTVEDNPYEIDTDKLDVYIKCTSCTGNSDKESGDLCWNCEWEKRKWC